MRSPHCCGTRSVAHTTTATTDGDYWGDSDKPHPATRGNRLDRRGVDGGVYVLVTKRREEDNKVYHARIYYRSGEIWYDGPPILTPADSGAFDYRAPVFTPVGTATRCT